MHKHKNPELWNRLDSLRRNAKPVSGIMQDLLDAGAINPVFIDDYKAAIEAEKKKEAIAA